jgi:DDT domain/Williams-Beuren syndrome DDT (WSD), D-TOX E motif
MQPPRIVYVTSPQPNSSHRAHASSQPPLTSHPGYERNASQLPSAASVVAMAASSRRKRRYPILTPPTPGSSQTGEPPVLPSLSAAIKNAYCYSDDVTLRPLARSGPLLSNIGPRYPAADPEVDAYASAIALSGHPSYEHGNRNDYLVSCSLDQQELRKHSNFRQHKPVDIQLASELQQQNSQTDYMQDAKNQQPADRRPRPKKPRPISLPPSDPDVSFPIASTNFGGIPGKSVGNLLQIWDFVIAFGRILRVPPCTFSALENSISAPSPQPLLNAILIRLVYTILADENLIDELNMSPVTLFALKTVKPSKRAKSADVVLKALPSLLSYEPDETEAEDRALARIVDVLTSSEDPLPFYSAIEPADRIRILGELVEYACMSDSLRECVQDSVEHAADERRKAREEVVANRRKLELQLKDLREELDVYRARHNLEPGSNLPACGSDVILNGDPVCGGGGGDVLPGGKKVSLREGDVSERLETRSLSSSPSETDVGSDEVLRKVGEKRLSSDAVQESDLDRLSRKQKLDVVRREREKERDERDARRGEWAIEVKIDKLRTSLKALRSVRLRQPRESTKEAAASTGCVDAPLINLDSESDPVRVYPLGTDREFRAYWYLPTVGRVWIENTHLQEWSYFSGKDEIADLLKWLSPSRRNEFALASAIRKYAPAIENAAIKAARREASNASSPVDELMDADYGDVESGDDCEADKYKKDVKHVDTDENAESKLNRMGTTGEENDIEDVNVDEGKCLIKRERLEKSKSEVAGDKEAEKGTKSEEGVDPEDDAEGIKETRNPTPAAKPPMRARRTAATQVIPGALKSAPSRRPAKTPVATVRDEPDPDVSESMARSLLAKKGLLDEEREVPTTHAARRTRGRSESK